MLVIIGEATLPIKKNGCKNVLSLSKTSKSSKTFFSLKIKKEKKCHKIFAEIENKYILSKS